REYVDAEDRPCTLEGCAAIGMVHPLQLIDAERGKWGEVLGDYEIIQPFPQLSRRVHTLEPAEQDATVVNRHPEANVPAMALRAILENGGWFRGATGGAGLVSYHTMEFQGAGVSAVLECEPGIPVGSGYYEGLPDQRLKGAYFIPWQPAGQAVWHGKALRLGDVNPLVMSEVLGIMALLASKAQ